MVFEKDYSYLEKEIAKARGNYSYHQSSFGGRMNFIATPKEKLGRELNQGELEKLGRDLVQIRREDFVGSLYPALNDLIKCYFEDSKKSLPSIDDFKRFSVEYDYIKHIVLERSLRGVQLDDDAFMNMNLIRNFTNDNYFKSMASNPVDLYFIDGEDIGLNGFVSMREKGDASSIMKFILEHYSFRYPNKGELAQRGYNDSKKSLQYLQDKCYDECSGLEEVGLISGEDIYDYFKPYFGIGEGHLEAKIMSILNKYFVDYVGGKIVAPKDMIADIDKKIRAGELCDLRRLEFRTKDYLSQGIKDKSITHAFNGSYKRSAIEIKFMPISEAYNAELGKRNHPKYKLDQQEDLGKYLNWHPELNYMMANLCCALKVNPKEVLGSFSYMLPDHETYKRFDFIGDDDPQLKLL